MAGVAAVQGSQVLVIGAGIAGLSAALSALETGATVTLLSRAPANRSPSVAFRGWMNAGDDSESHASDALRAGGPTSSTDIVHARCEAAAGLVAWLEAAGVPFDRDREGLRRRMGPSMSVARALGAGQGMGRQVVHALDARIRRFEEEGSLARADAWHLVDLILDDRGACAGAVALHVHSQEIRSFTAQAVILATGGPGRLLRPSTCALDSNGAGVGLAHRLGARLMDPDRLAWTPAVPGPDKDLALPDSSHLSAEGLDLRGLSKPELKRWGGSFAKMAAVYTGRNPVAELIPVRASVSGSLGGLRVDEGMATDIPGLFAAGEAAWGGFGAKALPGDELLAWIHQGREAGRCASAIRPAPSADRNANQAVHRLEQRLRQLHDSKAGSAPSGCFAQLSEALSKGLINLAGGPIPPSDLADLSRRVEAELQLEDRNATVNAALTAALDLPACLAWARSALACAMARQGVAEAASLLAAWTTKGPVIDRAGDAQ